MRAALARARAPLPPAVEEELAAARAGNAQVWAEMDELAAELDEAARALEAAPVVIPIRDDASTVIHLRAMARAKE